PTGPGVSRSRPEDTTSTVRNTTTEGGPHGRQGSRRPQGRGRGGRGGAGPEAEADRTPRQEEPCEARPLPPPRPARERRLRGGARPLQLRRCPVPRRGDPSERGACPDGASPARGASARGAYPGRVQLARRRRVRGPGPVRRDSPRLRRGSLAAGG